MASSIKTLTNLLDYCVEKNRVIAKNISNIGTENYRRQDVEFKEILNESSNSLIKTSSSKHISGLPETSSGNNYAYKYDENEEKTSGANNVNIEQEMSELAENTLRFKFASRKVGDYYRTMQKVIKGGGA